MWSVRYMRPVVYMMLACCGCAGFQPQPSPHAPRVALEEYYQARQSKENAPLFQNWAAYYEHLPIRAVDNAMLPYLKLCECAFWVNDEDLDAMTQRLEKGGEFYDVRRSVIYLTAVSGSGKTASVLAAFLDSVKNGRARRFTHYLYLAFGNNGKKCFRAADPTVIAKTSGQIARRQGAEFMLACVKRMLLLGDCFAFDNTATAEVFVTDSEQDVFNVSKSIDVDPSPRQERQVQKDLETLLDRCFDGTQDEPLRLLIHVDAYENIAGSSWENSNERKYADFRIGAMELLAHDCRTTCVVTSTDLLSDFPPVPSSGTCRLPCQRPIFDIWKFEKEEKMLGLDSINQAALGRAAQRALATLLFRLSCKLGTGTLLADYHVCKITGKGMDNHFASVFGRKCAENEYDMEKILSMEELTFPELM